MSYNPPSTVLVGSRPAAIQLIAVAAVCVAIAAAVVRLVQSWSHPLEFDDAFMFFRYARNLSHGLGIAWNPDGSPVYGMTSQAWMILCVPLTWLPVQAGPALELASWLFGAAAVVSMVATARRFSKSVLLTNPAVVGAVIALPLLCNPFFGRQLTTGMDTMLSLLTNTALVFVVLSYLQRPGQGRALVVGCVSFLTVFVRPDNAIVAFAVPGLAWLLCARPRDWRHLPALTGTPAALLLLQIALSDLYFKVPLPLSFYMKSGNSYAGFQNNDNAVQFAFRASLCGLPFAAILLATLTRRRSRLIAALLIPALLTGAYLLTVRQVMGWSGRYFIPFLPFVVIPALLCLDDALLSSRVSYRLIALRAALVLLVFGLLTPLEPAAARLYYNLVVPAPISAPVLQTKTATELPLLFWGQANHAFADLAGELPPGAVIAASEVGYLGYKAPDATIIDLAGLNDTHIATRGFSTDYILARAPDLIWFPHVDYTGMRAAFFGDKRLFGRYIVVRSAFNYGIAIRRDSPYRVQIEHRVRQAWSRLYPSNDFEDYVATMKAR